MGRRSPGTAARGDGSFEARRYAGEGRDALRHARAVCSSWQDAAVRGRRDRGRLRRVVVGIEDPDPRTAGTEQQRLRDAGIVADMGLPGRRSLLGNDRAYPARGRKSAVRAAQDGARSRRRSCREVLAGTPLSSLPERKRELRRTSCGHRRTRSSIGSGTARDDDLS